MAAERVRRVAPVKALHAAGELNGGALDRAAPARPDDELRSMAAFRVRETANRIATLATSATSEDLRRELLAICQVLWREERALREVGGAPRED
jgi:hypothetical protein